MMDRARGQTYLLLTVFLLVLCGCGGFKGVLTPTLSSINPTAVSAGSGDFTLIVMGANFSPGTAILWDGVALPTTVSSSTQLTAKITAAQIAAADTVSIRVMKPDSTTSNSMTLTITGESPGPSFSVTSISPAAVAAGSPDFTLTATGVGFISGAAVTLNGTPVATTFDSPGQLHAAIPASFVAAAATIKVGVTNPDKSTTSNLPLTVLSGSGPGSLPTLTAISPNTSPNTVTSPLTLTATGTNFVNGTQVMWNGVAMTTTFASSTELTAIIPVSQFNIPASFFDPNKGIATEQVFVINPDKTVSNELPFTITVLPSTTPNLVTTFNQQLTQRSKVGDPGFTLTLCGSLFFNGAVAYFGDTALQTSAISPAGTDCQRLSPKTNQPSQQVTAQVPASLLTAVAEVPVTIRNPQSGASHAIPYYVGINVYFDEAADVVWDSRFNLLYISKPTTSRKNADTVMAFSPRAGLTDAAAIWIYPLPAGSNPHRLSLSTDGKLYVGLDGANAVQQLVLTGARKPTAGNIIVLGSDPSFGPYFALDLQVMPGNSNTVAVARGVPAADSTSTAQGGVAVYDGTTQRPQTVGWTSSSPLLLDTLQWSTDGHTIYAANNEKGAADLYQLAVSGSGVTLVSDTQGVFFLPNLFIHLDGTTIYGDDGVIVDPWNTAARSNFAVGTGVIVPDSTRNEAYFIGQPASAFGTTVFQLQAFDLTTRSQISQLELYNVQGIPQHMIRWHLTSVTPAADGLAFTTKQVTNCNVSPCNVGGSRLYIVDLPF